jgi:hypothetical protein
MREGGCKHRNDWPDGPPSDVRKICSYILLPVRTLNFTDIYSLGSIYTYAMTVWYDILVRDKEKAASGQPVGYNF